MTYKIIQQAEFHVIVETHDEKQIIGVFDDAIEARDWMTKNRPYYGKCTEVITEPPDGVA